MMILALIVAQATQPVVTSPWTPELVTALTVAIFSGLVALVGAIGAILNSRTAGRAEAGSAANSHQIGQVQEDVRSQHRALVSVAKDMPSPSQVKLAEDLTAERLSDIERPPVPRRGE